MIFNWACYSGRPAPPQDVLDLPVCYLLALNIGLRNDCLVAMRKDVA